MKANTIDYLEFFRIIGMSKKLIRAGWIEKGVKDPESVAEHSFRVGMLAMVLADKFGYNLDKKKLMKMALLHDLAEVATGDVIVGRGELIDLDKRDKKEEKERQKIKEIFDKIGEGKEYASIFEEMIGRVTPEAKVFWQLDKIEMALQALEYEQEQGVNLEEFFLSVSLYYIQDELIKDIFNKILKSRKPEFQKRLQEKLKGNI